MAGVQGSVLSSTSWAPPVFLLHPPRGLPSAVCTCRPRCFQIAVTSEKGAAEQKWRPCQASTTGNPQQTSTCGYTVGSGGLFARKTGKIAFKLCTLLFPRKWGFTLKEKGETGYWVINDEKCVPVVSIFLKDAWSKAVYSQCCNSSPGDAHRPISTISSCLSNFLGAD